MKTVTFDENKWKLVPVEPGLEVLHAMGAAWESLSHDPSITSEARWGRLYRALLAAAPQQKGGA